MSDQIKLTIKDFRAIKEADIKLNGITVVSGVNGSGKSTLSKFLYYTFKLANTYDKVALQYLKDILSDEYYFLSILEREVLTARNDNNSSAESKRSRQFRTTRISLDKKDEIIESIRILANAYIDIKDSNLIRKENASRLLNVLKDTLNIKEKSNNDFESLINQLCAEMKMHFDFTEDMINARPASILRSELENSFNESKLPGKYEIKEYDVPVISNNSDFVPLIHSVQNVSYIDTPMMIGIYSENNYWDNLNFELRKKGSKSIVYNNQINDLIHKEILKGESEYDDDINSIQDELFLFKQDDGSVYNLLECATGVKSFSILQLLLKNGFLTKNTLLIIDEPEAHLHPQWIVEYARIIVLLNKQIGVKFFIASHSPDMISAIKYISEKEQTTQNLEYYLAEQTKENPYLFNYKSLGTNIDPIFESFNIALDRINQYGISNEHNDLF